MKSIQTTHVISSYACSEGQDKCLWYHFERELNTIKHLTAIDRYEIKERLFPDV